MSKKQRVKMLDAKATETAVEAPEAAPEAPKVNAAVIARDVRELLLAAAVGLDALELKGKGDWCRTEAMKMTDRGTRLAKRLASAGTRKEREAKKAEKAAAKESRKADRITKLREKLAKLTEGMETEEEEKEEAKE